MKAVLISIQPKWVEKIVNGQKTIEVRKTAPKQVPFKGYIYCTFPKKPAYTLWLNRGTKNKFLADGKVIGEYMCDKVDEYTFSHYEAEYRVTHVEQKAMCLNQPELIQYGKGKTLYGWHISDLKIYDKPKELSEFRVPCPTSCENCKNPLYYECWCEEKGIKVLTRAPQSWQYVEELN